MENPPLFIQAIGLAFWCYVLYLVIKDRFKK